MMRRSAKPDTSEPVARDRCAEARVRPGSPTAMPNRYRGLRERPTTDEPARPAPRPLIVWAGEDRCPERRVAGAGLAPCDNGRLEIIEHRTHWLHRERPDIVDRRITALMTGDVRGCEHAMQSRRSAVTEPPG